MTNPLTNSRPKLAARVNAAGAQEQRGIVLALLEHVYRRHVPIHNADSVLSAVRAGQYGDSPLRQELWKAHRVAEGHSFDYGEQIENIERSGGTPPPELFRKSRAEHQVHAAYLAGYHALEPDPAIAAAQVIHKSIFASADVKQVLDVINPYLPDPS